MERSGALSLVCKVIPCLRRHGGGDRGLSAAREDVGEERALPGGGKVALHGEVQPL